MTLITALFGIVGPPRKRTNSQKCINKGRIEYSKYGIAHTVLLGLELYLENKTVVIENPSGIEDA